MTSPTPESLYRTVRLIRRFEERAIELVRAGEIVGGIHPYIGQEAIAGGGLRRAALRRHHHSAPTAATATCWPRAPTRAGCWPSWPAATPGSTGAGAARCTPPTSRVGIYGANGIVGAGGAIATGAAWAHAPGRRATASR